jgi:transcriptional regulator with XRE-family HTH domain
MEQESKKVSDLFLIPAQVRAGRAFLNWSRDELAKAAGVSASSVRDIEMQRRTADAGILMTIQRTLVNAGVVFVPGDEIAGPGVRLNTNRANLIRRPTQVMQWVGVPADVECRGKLFTVYVSRELLEDLENLTQASKDQLIEAFEKHEGAILDEVAHKASNPKNFDQQGNMHLRSLDS